MTKKRKCRIDGCRREAGKKATLCHRCDRQHRKEKDPYKYHWQILKDNAKRRGKPFGLTVEEFTEFCYETDILHGRGRTSTSLHIDCIDDELGYVKGNIRPLTNRENVQKEHERRRMKKVVTYDWQTGIGRLMPLTSPDAGRSPDVPF